MKKVIVISGEQSVLLADRLFFSLKGASVCRVDADAPINYFFKNPLFDCGLEAKRKQIKQFRKSVLFDMLFTDINLNYSHLDYVIVYNVNDADIFDKLKDKFDTYCINADSLSVRCMAYNISISSWRNLKDWDFTLANSYYIENINKDVESIEKEILSKSGGSYEANR